MNILEQEPIRFIEEQPGDKPGLVILAFAGAEEGFWKHTWYFSTDKATATALKQFCEDRAKRDLPIYRQTILDGFGSPPD